MKRKSYLLACMLLFSACSPRLHPEEINPRYTPLEARKHVNWWAENIRPSQRAVFDAALSGDHAALRRILNDTDNSFGPQDQGGDSASVLSGAFLLVLGDEAFAEFIRNESDAVKKSVFGSFTHGPWSLADDASTDQEAAETKFSRAFPKTAKIRSQFYADGLKRARRVVATFFHGKAGPPQMT